MNQIELQNFDQYCNNEKVIGIGETGIDLYHSDQFLKEQTQVFETHIEASINHSLPIIIHQRNSEKEIIDILKNFARYSAVYFTKDGSLILPLIGSGAKKGLSVSISIDSKGASLIISLKFDAFLNVIIPEIEM